MLRRLEAAKLCFRFNQPQWTAPILKSLSEDMENIGLDTWDPQFCSDVWGTLIKSYEYLKGIGELDNEGLLKLRYFKDKLFTINLAMAAALSPKQNQE